MVEFLNLAWDELYELEFDQVFGAWRGVHFEPETETVHITWENMYGAPLMISIHRVTRALRKDYPGTNLSNWSRSKSNASAACRRGRDKSRGEGSEIKETITVVWPGLMMLKR